MAKGRSVSVQKQAAQQLYDMLLPAEVRHYADLFAQIHEQVKARRSVLGVGTFYDSLHPTPETAMRVRDWLLTEMMGDFTGVARHAVCAGGKGAGSVLTPEQVFPIFMMLSQADVYFWEPEIHQAALTGSEVLTGTPFPKEAWSEGIEFWVSPYTIRSTFVHLNIDGDNGLCLDTPCLLQGTLFYGQQLDAGSRAYIETTDDPLYSNLITGAVQFLVPFPESIVERIRQGDNVTSQELGDAYKPMFRANYTPRIRSVTYYSVGEPLSYWAVPLAASRLFLRERVAEVAARTIGNERARRHLEKRHHAAPQVRVVGLRKPEKPLLAGNGYSEPRKVDWTCQWPVRGTWCKREKATATGKPTVYYRKAHIKGPEGKPFKIPAEGIWHVLR